MLTHQLTNLLLSHGRFDLSGNLILAWVRVRQPLLWEVGPDSKLLPCMETLANCDRPKCKKLWPNFAFPLLACTKFGPTKFGLAHSVGPTLASPVLGDAQCLVRHSTMTAKWSCLLAPFGSSVRSVRMTGLPFSASVCSSATCSPWRPPYAVKIVTQSNHFSSFSNQPPLIMPPLVPALPVAFRAWLLAGPCVLGASDDLGPAVLALWPPQLWRKNSWHHQAPLTWEHLSIPSCWKQFATWSWAVMRSQRETVNKCAHKLTYETQEIGKTLEWSRILNMSVEKHVNVMKHCDAIVTPRAQGLEQTPPDCKDFLRKPSWGKLQNWLWDSHWNTNLHMWVPVGDLMCPEAKTDLQCKSQHVMEACVRKRIRFFGCTQGDTFISPSTWEDCSLVFPLLDPADCATGPSSYFHSFIPRNRRVDFSLTVGTSSDHRAGLSYWTHLRPVAIVFSSWLLHVFHFDKISSNSLSKLRFLVSWLCISLQSWRTPEDNYTAFALPNLFAWFLFFHKCINGFKVLHAPKRRGSVVPRASRRPLPPGFRGPIPLSAFPLFTFLCHGLPQHRRCLFKAGQSFSFTRCMKTRGIPCALFLSSKRPRLPILAIIHHHFHHLHRHHQRMRVECSFLPSILPFPCSLTTSCAEVNMHDLDVCSRVNGRTTASMIAILTTSWFFQIFKSCPEIFI